MDSTASTKCLLGCTDVRYGARIVSILDFWICVILTIKCLSLLNPFHGSIDYVDHVHNNIILNDLTVFGYLFVISVFLYVNYSLKDSTYDYKIHKIHQWLAINTIFLSVYIIATTYITIKQYRSYTVHYSILLGGLTSVIHACQIYVVKRFYDERLDAMRPPHATTFMAAAARGGPDTVHVQVAARSPEIQPTTTVRPVYQEVQRTAFPATAPIYPELPAAESLHGQPRESDCKPPGYSPSHCNDNVAV